jgi:hypothetical protein
MERAVEEIEVLLSILSMLSSPMLSPCFPQFALSGLRGSLGIVHPA